jgi:CheY-like chemotaxis protein
MIAMLHDGALEAASAGPGSGATFTLRLPLVSEDTISKSEKKAVGRLPYRMRVLAIEDNKDFAQLFRHMLEIMGCELDITSDARSGLKLAHERLPELIFCDIGLPGDMNGIDFARAVRADPELAHIPLVAVSGYSSPEDRQKAMAAGFDRVCAKPVKFADISDALSVYSTQRDAAS